MSTADPGRGASDDAREQPVGQLLSELSSDVSTLVRQEIALARAELTNKAKAGGKGAGMLAAAGVVGLAVLGSLTAFLIALLALWMPTWAAALIVTGGWLVVTVVLALVGRAQLRRATPAVPEETVDSVKEDVQWAKTQLQSGKR